MAALLPVAGTAAQVGGTVATNTVTSNANAGPGLFRKVVVRTVFAVRAGGSRIIAIGVFVFSALLSLALLAPWIEACLKPIVKQAKSLRVKTGKALDKAAQRSPTVGALVYIAGVFIRAFMEYVVNLILFILKHPIALFTAVFFIAFFTAIQYYLANIAATANAFGYAGVEVYNFGARVVNFTLDGANSYVLPIYNGITRNQMLILDHTYTGLSENTPDEDFGTDLTTGRRLQGPPQSSIELIIRNYAWFSEVYNQYILINIDIFFAVLYKPFVFIANFLIGVIGRFACMLAGEVCTLREIVQATINLLGDFLRLITFGLIPIPRLEGLACEIAELAGVNCELCKGTFYSAMAGMFEALLRCTTTRRSLVVACTETTNGKFVETVDSLIVHESMTEYNSCPHSKGAFSSFGNARNNYRFKTKDYTVNYHGIEFHSTFEDGDHVLITNANMSASHVRRRMRRLDTSRVVDKKRRHGHGRNTAAHKSLSRDAKADLIKAKYTENNGRCGFGNSWSDIYYLATDLTCLAETITGRDMMSNIATMLPQKKPHGHFRSLTDHIEKYNYVMDAVSAHPSRRLSDVMEDLTHPHQVTPFYGMMMHMIQNRRKASEEAEKQTQRRRLAIEDFCAPQLTCANGQCVDDLKNCVSPTEWNIGTYLTYVGQEAGNSFKDQTVDGTTLEITNCIDTWKNHPSTDPYSFDVIVGGRTEGVLYCSPLIPYIYSRPPKWEFQLSESINELCASNTPFNQCNCSTIFYDPPASSVQDGVFWTLDLQYSFLNALIWIRYFFVLIGTPLLFLAELWKSLFEGADVPSWFRNLFLGTNGGMTYNEVLFCWFLHTGDFFFFLVVIWLIIFYIVATIRVFFPKPYKEYVLFLRYRRWTKMQEIYDRKIQERLLKLEAKKV